MYFISVENVLFSIYILDSLRIFRSSFLKNISNADKQVYYKFLFFLISYPKIIKSSRLNKDP